MAWWMNIHEHSTDARIMKHKKHTILMRDSCGVVNEYSWALNRRSYNRHQVFYLLASGLVFKFLCRLNFAPLYELPIVRRPKFTCIASRFIEKITWNIIFIDFAESPISASDSECEFCLLITHCCSKKSKVKFHRPQKTVGGQTTGHAIRQHAS